MEFSIFLVFVIAQSTAVIYSDDFARSVTELESNLCSYAVHQRGTCCWIYLLGT